MCIPAHMLTESFGWFKFEIVLNVYMFFTRLDKTNVFISDF